MTELTLNLMCISMRNGVELWIEDARAQNLKAALKSPNPSQFVELPDGQLINRADIVGLFSAKTMSDATRRKNGGWQCQYGEWHDKGQKCQCLPLVEKRLIARREEAIKNCGKCHNGYILPAGENVAQMCECVANL